jgi:DNA-binding NtrC family response regulator
LKSILLIDDDPEFTAVFSNIIEHLGHHVSISDSVKDAKEWLDLNEFDHLLIDFMLPDGSGLHVFEHVQQKRKIPKITFITGNPEIKSVISDIAGPNVNYLMKPIQREDMRQCFNQKKSNLQRKRRLKKLLTTCILIALLVSQNSCRNCIK